MLQIYCLWNSFWCFVCYDNLLRLSKRNQASVSVPLIRSVIHCCLKCNKVSFLNYALFFTFEFVYSNRKVTFHVGLVINHFYKLNLKRWYFLLIWNLWNLFITVLYLIKYAKLACTIIGYLNFWVKLEQLLARKIFETNRMEIFLRCGKNMRHLFRTQECALTVMDEKYKNGVTKNSCLHL